MPSGFSMSRSKNSELRFYLDLEKTKNMLYGEGKFLLDRFRPTFYNFIFTFPELTFHDCSLAPHQNMYISAK
jgi:hypothetical protein